MRVILIALTSVTMINGGNKAGLFGVTVSGEDGNQPQSIFPKVVSLFHNNTLQADSLFLLQVIDFLFYAPKWTLSSGATPPPLPPLFFRV